MWYQALFIRDGVGFGKGYCKYKVYDGIGISLDPTQLSSQLKLNECTIISPQTFLQYYTVPHISKIEPPKLTIGERLSISESSKTRLSTTIYIYLVPRIMYQLISTMFILYIKSASPHIIGSLAQKSRGHSSDSKACLEIMLSLTKPLNTK